MPSLPPVPLPCIPPVADGATLYLLMNMREVEPTEASLRRSLEQRGGDPGDNSPSLIEALREAGCRVFLPELPPDPRAEA